MEAPDLGIGWQDKKGHFDKRKTHLIKKKYIVRIVWKVKIVKSHACIKFEIYKGFLWSYEEVTLW